LIDFIFWLHFIKPVYVIGTFNIGTVLLLIVITAGIGYAIDYTFGVLWNRFHGFKRQPSETNYFLLTRPL
jgi:hypothetical protein